MPVSSAMVSSARLYEQLGIRDTLSILDIRGRDECIRSGKYIPGAILTGPNQIENCYPLLLQSQPVLVYCSRGEGNSQKASAKLVKAGFDSHYLQNGFQGWLASGFVSTKVRSDLNTPFGSRWITRERPKIDRIACPWLIRRFIDPSASFFYAPAHRVRRQATSLQAQAFDVADVIFTHHGTHCSFDAFLNEFDLKDPALSKLAMIVRASDTGELQLSEEAPGLLALSLGLSAIIKDDIVLLEQGMIIYDALYAWCKKLTDKKHFWPQAT